MMQDKKSIEEIIRSNEHIVAIHQPKYTSLPEIDYSLFEKEKIADTAIAMLKEYLSRPIIEDNLGAGIKASEKRSQLRKELEEAHGTDVHNYLKTTKLNMCSIGSVPLALNYLARSLVSDDSLIGKEINSLKKFMDSHLKDYKGMPSAEKIEFAQKVEDRIYGMLKSIAKEW